MSDNSTSGGVGFSSLLQLTFIILKLCKVILWSWWWVLSPMWIGTALILISLLGIWVISTMEAKTRHKKTLDSLDKFRQQALQNEQRRRQLQERRKP